MSITGSRNSTFSYSVISFILVQCHYLNKHINKRHDLQKNIVGYITSGTNEIDSTLDKQQMAYKR